VGSLKGDVKKEVSSARWRETKKKRVGVAIPDSHQKEEKKKNHISNFAYIIAHIPMSYLTTFLR